jgi:two-component system cell cycle sensor histidine kinase/response regulator CckA
MSKPSALAGCINWGHIFKPRVVCSFATFSQRFSLFIAVDEVVCLGAALLALSLIALYREYQNSRRLEAFFKDSLDAMSGGKILFDEHEQFVMANSRACALLPFLQSKLTTPPTLSGFLDFMYDNAVESDEHSITSVLGRAARQSGTGFREIVVLPDQRLCLVEILKTAFNRTFLILNDVSESKRQEDDLLMLRQYNNELYQAVEAATNGLMISRLVDGAHKIFFANRAFCEIFNTRQDVICGEPVVRIFARLKDQDIEQTIAKAMRGLEKVTLSFHLNDQNGQRWYDLRLSPMSDQCGTLNLYIGVFNEVTELKMREAEAFKTQKLEALGQLAAGVAHDFNNLLSIIDGYTRLAGNHVDADSKVQSYLQPIRTASRRGATLVKQMLTFSRHKIVADTVIDLAHIVREQELLLRPLMDASIKLSVQSRDSHLFVECTPDHITQIIMNLAINARDAMQNGGALRIEARKIHAFEMSVMIREQIGALHFVCLSISDTGTGMQKDVIERIFDPFYTTKEHGKGTGLGLSIVYGLVKQMGGYIDVKSAVGTGTTMLIYLPLTDKKPNRLLQGTPHDVRSMRLDGYTALVAEDEPDLLLLVSEMLERMGMRVLKACNGHDALLLQDEYDGIIDLLLTDVVMPEMNGVDLAEFVVALRPEIKVIFMSGYPASGNMARVQLPENAYFVAKPLQYETFARTVFKRLINQEQQDDEFKLAHWTNQDMGLNRGIL